MSSVVNGVDGGDHTRDQAALKRTHPSGDTMTVRPDIQQMLRDRLYHQPADSHVLRAVQTNPNHDNFVGFKGTIYPRLAKNKHFNTMSSPIILLHIYWLSIFITDAEAPFRPGPSTEGPLQNYHDEEGL